MTIRNNHFIKQLIFQSTHRGSRELDLLLGRFAKVALENLSDPELTLFAQLLQEDDHDLWGWLTEQDVPYPRIYEALLPKIKNYQQ